MIYDDENDDENDDDATLGDDEDDTDVDAVSAHARVRRQLTPCVARDAQRAVTFASVARIACDSDARVG